MSSKPYEPLVKEGEWDCEDFKICPFDENMLCHNCAFKKLNDIKTHLENYPDEKGDKYLLRKMAPDTAGPTYFNSVYFLTDLDTWKKGLDEILEDQTSEVKTQ